MVLPQVHPRRLTAQESNHSGIKQRVCVCLDSVLNSDVVINILSTWVARNVVLLYSGEFVLPEDSRDQIASAIFPYCMQFVHMHRFMVKSMMFKLAVAGECNSGMFVYLLRRVGGAVVLIHRWRSGYFPMRVLDATHFDDGLRDVRHVAKCWGYSWEPSGYSSAVIFCELRASHLRCGQPRVRICK